VSNSASQSQSDAPAEHFDVLIVGAGISGLGSAYHLKQQCPEKSFVVLEAMETFGGTWHTHRYPGARSDSDLYTYGYRFKPWLGVPLATRDEINTYLGEVISENDLTGHIRYRHLITHASWSSADNLWTVVAHRADTDETCRFTTRFLWMCQGYYRHSQGYTPDWPGMETFRGPIVHPQTWPTDLDYTDKKVIVIGSGASAASVIPALAERASHVTMLQRSPTFFFPMRNAMALAEELRMLKIDERWVHEIVRRRTLLEQNAIRVRCRTEPESVKADLLALVRKYLPADYDFDKHFVPSYRPWQQRVCFVPDGDLFKTIASGKASVVTDHIERFTPEGILLKSGETLTADIIVTATGLILSGQGDIEFQVDGKPVQFSDTITYHGMMFTGIPNLTWIFGYFRQAWTLRVDLIGDFICRLLKHMDHKGARRVTPTLRPEDKDMTLGPWISPDSFNSGYVVRHHHLLPKTGDKPEWQHTQDYWTEREVLPTVDLDNAILVYGYESPSNLHRSRGDAGHVEHVSWQAKGT
jgi:cation diffusion facilitator CzcD-associated flavoprotein CzcO